MFFWVRGLNLVQEYFGLFMTS